MECWVVTMPPLHCCTGAFSQPFYANGGQKKSMALKRSVQVALQSMQKGSITTKAVPLSCRTACAVCCTQGLAQIQEPFLPSCTLLPMHPNILTGQQLTTEVLSLAMQWMCFDACPVTACLPYTARRMKAVTPDAKLIFMVTRPVFHLIASAAAAANTTCYAVAL